MRGRLKNVVVHPIKEEVRRRHRIKDVHIYSHDGRAGVQLITKAGTVTLVSTKHLAVSLDRIRYHLPHMREDLECLAVWEEDELKDLLVGHYLYGKVTEIEWDGTISTAIR